MKHDQYLEPALVLIDFQKGFDEKSFWGGKRNNLDAEVKAGRLLRHWREKQWPVFHVQHLSRNPASPLAESQVGHQFKEEVVPLPGETVVQKKVNSAFIGTNLKQLLEKQSITQIVIAGLTTDHCVSTTARMASNFGFDTYVVGDATATFGKRGVNNKLFSADIIHETALASLHSEFATVTDVENLLAIF